MKRILVVGQVVGPIVFDGGVNLVREMPNLNVPRRVCSAACPEWQ